MALVEGVIELVVAVALFAVLAPKLKIPEGADVAAADAEEVVAGADV